MKVVRMTGVEDDLSSTAKALGSWSEPQLVEGLEDLSHPFQGLVTLLSVGLQTGPFLTVIQHEDELDVVHCPYERWKCKNCQISHSEHWFEPMDVPKIQIRKLWYFPYWRALSIISFSVSLGTISSSFPDFISLKLFWCDETIHWN